jgi:hypothetical protein
MIKLLAKLLAALLLLALAIIAFIKLLPWCLAAVALVALTKFSHDWLCRQGITPSAWWPWPSKPDDGHQPSSAPAGQ